MKDAMFLSRLVTLLLLPGDLKEKVESKPTATEAASCFLDSIIKPAVESSNNEPFNILLSELEKSDYINLTKLAQDIKKEIHRAAGQELLSGKI